MNDRPDWTFLEGMSAHDPVLKILVFFVHYRVEVCLCAIVDKLFNYLTKHGWLKRYRPTTFQKILFRYAYFFFFAYVST